MLARYSSRIMPGSESEFIFAVMKAGFPARAAARTFSISRTNLSRIQSGATTRRFQKSGSE